MSALGSRLREERARLGLSQAAFGAAGGVRTGAQFSYEAGNRFPDARYLSAISARGADIHYILTGRRLPGAASAFRPADTPIVSCDRGPAPSRRAYVIYDNWDNIVSYFTEKIDRVRSAFDVGLLNGVLAVLAEFNPFTLMMDASIGLFEYLTSWDFSALTERIRSAFDIDLFAIGAKIIRSVWDGMLSIVGQMVDAVSARIGAIVPSWLRAAWDWVETGSTGEPAVAPAQGSPVGRALGGAARAGQLYRWMEEGEELFVPRVDGSVISNRELRVLRAGGGGGRTAPSISIGEIVVNAAPGMSPQDVARTVRRELERMAARGAELHDGGSYAA